MDSLSREVSVRELRADLKDVLGSVAYGGRRIGVTRNGTLAAVIVSVEDLANLERYEVVAVSPITRRTRPTEMVTLNISQLRREVAQRRAQPYPPTPDPWSASAGEGRDVSVS